MIERKQYIEAGLKRRFGMMPESQAKLDKFNWSQTDWTARCRVCGAQLEGSMEKLMEHRHVDPPRKSDT